MGPEESQTCLRPGQVGNRDWGYLFPGLTCSRVRLVSVGLGVSRCRDGRLGERTTVLHTTPTSDVDSTSVRTTFYRRGGVDRGLEWRLVPFNYVGHLRIDTVSLFRETVRFDSENFVRPFTGTMARSGVERVEVHLGLGRRRDRRDFSGKLTKVPAGGTEGPRVNSL